MTPPAAVSPRILIVDDDQALRQGLSALLADAGYVVEQAADGPDALRRLVDRPVDLVLLDVDLPSMNGLQVLARVHAMAVPPLVVMMTSDATAEPLLQAVRRQAYRYLHKPFAPGAIVQAVTHAMAAAPAAALPIEVVSASPEWIELIAPCALEVVHRIQSFVMQIEAGLPEQVRESVGQAFGELLNNAVEWGGKLDPTRKVRISCLRARRLLLYRIADPGEGFDIERLRHAAICNPDDDPLQHATVREAQGMRPGGLGLVMTRSLVDELIYNEARNEVVFIKYLD